MLPPPNYSLPLPGQTYTQELPTSFSALSNMRSRIDSKNASARRLKAVASYWREKIIILCKLFSQSRYQWYCCYTEAAMAALRATANLNLMNATNSPFLCSNMSSSLDAANASTTKTRPRHDQARQFATKTLKQASIPSTKSQFEFEQ